KGGAVLGEFCSFEWISSSKIQILLREVKGLFGFGELRHRAMSIAAIRPGIALEVVQQRFAPNADEGPLRDLRRKGRELEPFLWIGEEGRDAGFRQQATKTPRVVLATVADDRLPAGARLLQQARY